MIIAMARTGIALDNNYQAEILQQRCRQNVSAYKIQFMVDANHIWWWDLSSTIWDVEVSSKRGICLYTRIWKRQDRPRRRAREVARGTHETQAAIREINARQPTTEPDLWCRKFLASWRAMFRKTAQAYEREAWDVFQSQGRATKTTSGSYESVMPAMKALDGGLYNGYLAQHTKRLDRVLKSKIRSGIDYDVGNFFQGTHQDEHGHRMQSENLTLPCTRLCRMTSWQNQLRIKERWYQIRNEM